MNINKTLENLNNNGFKAMCFEKREEAVSFLKEEIKNEVVGIGGSKTIDDLGLYDILKENNKVYWHWKNPGDKNKYNEFTCYLSSANAISEDGQLVNMDGGGNRISATLYGPSRVFFIAGKNKITPDLSSAIERVGSVAAPLNASRFAPPEKVKDGKCTDEDIINSICRAMTIYFKPMSSFKEVYVIIIKEDLGF